jgi:hypothetical protein
MKRLLVLLVLITCTVQAEIYKSKNDKGEWVYSDKPSPNAERMKLPPLSTYAPPPALQRSVSDSEDPEPAQTNDKYKSMVFVEPVNDATVRENSGLVKVIVGLDPPLKIKKGHKIQFYLDGNPYGEAGASSAIIVKEVDRGTHVLKAQVLGVEGKLVFRAKPVTFHLHRESLNNPNRVKPTPLPTPLPTPR